ncbi:MAG: DNA-processing protein DprA [Pseudomonadota bacterium]
MTPELAAVALHRLPGHSAHDKHALVHQLGGLDRLAGADDRTLIAAGFPAGDVVAWRALAASECAADTDWAKASDCHLLSCEHPAYPRGLSALDDAPLVLWARGDLDLLAPPKIAVVGSRNPSRGGEENARSFAADLAVRGLVVVSGLAAGIDAAAHRGALDAGGMTLAVVGTGADRVYPAANRALAHDIAQQGVLISEFPLGTAPRPHHFPRRNRLISAVSLGVLVVEAAVRSGSLITARQAGEQGRSVMAIPGSIHNPMARGCHRLIREGAKLVECSADVLEDIGPALAASSGHLTPGADAERVTSNADAEPAGTALPDAHRHLLHCLGHDTLSVDTLVTRTGDSVANVSSMLLLLELGGHVCREKDGRFSRQNAAVGTIDA